MGKFPVPSKMDVALHVADGKKKPSCGANADRLGLEEATTVAAEPVSQPISWFTFRKKSEAPSCKREALSRATNCPTMKWLRPMSGSLRPRVPLDTTLRPSAYAAPIGAPLVIWASRRESSWLWPVGHFPALPLRCRLLSMGMSSVDKG